MTTRTLYNDDDDEHKNADEYGECNNYMPG